MVGKTLVHYSLIVFFAGFALLFGCRHTPDPAAIVLRNVSVINTNDGQVRSNSALIIVGNRITQVGDSSSIRIPVNARVIEGNGRFLIPGLWDMHIHTFFGGDFSIGARELTLPLLIAHGLTGVRDMGSDLDEVLKARDDIETGRQIGPRMLVAGPMLDGPATSYSVAGAMKVTTPDEGTNAVRMLAQRGVDFIKVQSVLPKDVYEAVSVAARQQHLTFVGHVPNGIRASDAITAGQRSFEHLLGIFEASSEMTEPFQFVLHGPSRFLASVNTVKEAAIVRTLAEHQTWQCPTLYWEHVGRLLDATDTGKDPSIQYVPSALRKQWPGWITAILKADDDPLQTRQEFFRYELGLVKRLHDAGVPFLAGTDTPAGIALVPGISLHRELQNLVQAGFTPLEALQTATLNPAIFIGKTNDFGNIEINKIADLVLLEQNPLIDIQNTQSIVAVIKDGRYFDRAQLDQILAAAAKFAMQH